MYECMWMDGYCWERRGLDCEHKLLDSEQLNRLEKIALLSDCCIDAWLVIHAVLQVQLR